MSSFCAVHGHDRYIWHLPLITDKGKAKADKIALSGFFSSNLIEMCR